MKLAGLVFLLAVLAGCGGNAATPASAVPTSTPAPGPSSTPTPVATPNTVTVSAGQTASGIDIAVSAIAGSPAPNAQDLGVAELTGRGSAANTGAEIHRGQTARVLLFGPGLSGDMQVVVRGPSDITISDINTISSTSGTPGVSFVAAVAGNAALGARTVVLQSSKGDVTTFAGGLEVIP